MGVRCAHEIYIIEADRTAVRIVECRVECCGTGGFNTSMDNAVLERILRRGDRVPADVL
jgi:hypothetical protein